MDDDKATAIFVVFFILLVFGVTISSIAGCGIATIGEREQAIKAGVGRWEINEKTGASKFVYGPPKEAK